jgi:hypothetical protein
LPIGLTVDFDAQFVYWLELNLKCVEVMDYEGRNRSNIIREGMKIPVSLRVFQNKIYWTDRKTR